MAIKCKKKSKIVWLISFVFRKRDDVNVCVEDLTTIKVENGHISEAGARLNISVALQYLNSWLQVIS